MPVNPFVAAINSLLPEPQASLLNGILFGIKTQLPRTFYHSLIETGTLHIVALSGMNISILANLLAKTTLFLGKKVSLILTLILIFLFVWFVGATPSVLRASLMASFSLLAVYFGRIEWSLLSLILSALIMLIFNFSLLANLSFQLSFLATLGIILAGNKKERQKEIGAAERFISTLKENFKLTFSAQLFTLPVILYNFRRLSIIAPVANLLIEWVIQPVMVMGFVTAILGWLWLPLGLLPAWVVWVPLSYLIKVIEFLAKIPLASISF